MWFDSWSDIGRVVMAGAAVYAALIVMLRVTGKRTLSKWNAFDFVVTVAFGSTLASALLSDSVSVSEGVAALAMLVGLQYAVTWLSVRVDAFRRLVKGEPTLLVLRGRYREEAMRKARIPKEEVRAALRSHGLSSLSEAEAVVLETDGTFSVMENLGDLDAEGLSLEGVRGFEAGR
jgi:uncharacterized membrane protein YcaP (DUF421 family)